MSHVLGGLTWHDLSRVRAFTHVTEQNRKTEPASYNVCHVLQDNPHMLAARNIAPLLGKMCTGYVSQTAQYAYGPTEADAVTLLLDRVESVFTAKYDAHTPDWSLDTGGLWDDLMGQRAAVMPSPVSHRQRNIALFPRACCSALDSAEINNCLASSRTLPHSLWQNGPKDIAKAPMPGVSEAGDRRAEGPFTNGADAGICTSLDADEYGSCLVKLDATGCSTLTDVSINSQSAAAMVLLHDSPQSDAFPEQPVRSPQTLAVLEPNILGLHICERAVQGTP